MDAKEFLQLDSTAFNDVTFRKCDIIKIHIEVLCKIMEQYHQSKVNNGVLDDVINGSYDWHKSKGHTSLKRDDLEEYVNSLKNNL